MQRQTEQDKQVTVAVPEDRLAEFYGFFARFLAARRPGCRRGPHAHGGPRHGGHRCTGRHEASPEEAATQSAGAVPDTEPAA